MLKQKSKPFSCPANPSPELSLVVPPVRPGTLHLVPAEGKVRKNGPEFANFFPRGRVTDGQTLRDLRVPYSSPSFQKGSGN